MGGSSSSGCPPVADVKSSSGNTNEPVQRTQSYAADGRQQKYVSKLSSNTSLSESVSRKSFPVYDQKNKQPSQTIVEIFVSDHTSSSSFAGNFPLSAAGRRRRSSVVESNSGSNKNKSITNNCKVNNSNKDNIENCDISSASNTCNLLVEDNNTSFLSKISTSIKQKTFLSRLPQSEQNKQQQPTGFSEYSTTSVSKATEPTSTNKSSPVFNSSGVSSPRGSNSGLQVHSGFSSQISNRRTSENQFLLNASQASINRRRTSDNQFLLASARNRNRACSATRLYSQNRSQACSSASIG